MRSMLNPKAAVFRPAASELDGGGIPEQPAAFPPSSADPARIGNPLRGAMHSAPTVFHISEGASGVHTLPSTPTSSPISLVASYAQADPLEPGISPFQAEPARIGNPLRGAMHSAPTVFHHSEGASGVSTPPFTSTAGSNSPVTHFASADRLGPVTTTGNSEHAPCGISVPGAADSAQPEFHHSEGASGVSTPPSALPLVDLTSQPAAPHSLSLTPVIALGCSEHADREISVPGAADSAPPGIHASEGASGVHTPPSTMAASPISPATPTSGIVSLAPADAAPSPRVEGAHSPLACVAVVTHSPQSTDGCPTAWVQTKATVTFPNGLAPEAESLAALGLYPLNNALTAPTNRATHPLFSDSLPNTDSTWHACGSPHGPLLRQLA